MMPTELQVKKVDYMLEMRASGRDKVQDYADKFGVPFYPVKNHGT